MTLLTDIFRDSKINTTGQVNTGSVSVKGLKNSLANPVLWLTFFIYIFILVFTIAHHELWGDEIHSWNIAKASGSYFDLIANTRYEGHPPVWYTIIWTISKFTHHPGAIQAAQATIASLVVFMILFLSPFPLLSRILMPFGYYFLFEFGVLSRNYAIGILLAFCICLIIRKEFRYKIPIYYFLLFLLSNTHLLALLLAGSLHLYFLLWNFEKHKKISRLIVAVITGVIIFLPALYFIFPPSDSQLNVQFWMNRWNIHNLTAFIQAPVISFIPVPAWWEYNAWNTQFLTEARNMYGVIRFISLITLLILLVIVFRILRNNKKSLLLFIANLAASFIIAVVVFPLTSARYAGFIFIGFITAYWLYCYETPVSNLNKQLVNSLLIVQLIAAGIMVTKDIRYPFSNDSKVNELIQEVPAGKAVVTDYWALNPVATFVDKPFYCIDLQQEKYYLQWDRTMKKTFEKKDRYCNGFKNFFREHALTGSYLVSTNSPELLEQIDPYLDKAYHVQLVDAKEGAIEKGGNLYLYLVQQKPLQ